MTAIISLIIIAFILWKFIGNAKKPPQSDQIAPKTTINTNPSSPVYQDSPDYFNGEGSDLIRKYTGKQDDDYVAEMLADIDVDTRPKRSATKLVKYPVIGSISFDYIDTKHELSSRVVNTKEVDARHISGYCRTAKAFRTFLIEGIVSDVTDTDTGEVIPVDRWIKQAKKAAKAHAPKK